MVEISNLRVYDLAESIIASGYPKQVLPFSKKEYNKLVDSITSIVYNIPEEYIPSNSEEERAKKAITRACKLSQASGGHDNFLKGIRVSFDLKYPNYFSPELQRYNWIDIVSSSSKMHKLSFIATSNCFNKYVKPEVIEIVKKEVEKYNDNKTYENFISALSNCPLGVELFMRISTNYLQLKNIYKQRHDHRLKEDWGAFCKMIETLPCSNFII